MQNRKWAWLMYMYADCTSHTVLCCGCARASQYPNMYMYICHITGGVDLWGLLMMFTCCCLPGVVLPDTPRVCHQDRHDHHLR